MRPYVLVAVRALLVLTVVTGLIFPLLITGASQLVFDKEADGSRIERNGATVGSSLLGQTFTTRRYFHARPSAAGAAAVGAERAVPDDRSTVASGASNLGPTSRELASEIEQRVRAYRLLNGLNPHTAVPVDAVTASGSGVDPQISVANARLQAPRVARARDLPFATVLELIEDHTSERILAILGEKGVNVLELNLALDARGEQR